ncbi:hypothetical protein ZWY2020_046036 [Hordeum vulgare]|nr:hypothetical protein ZWY2020_046036 [Hordeum vulgare]
MAAANDAGQFQKFQIQRENTTFDAYVVGKQNAPGVVVLQEWWGVNNDIKNHAIHASQIGGGYRALIPDLYRGKVALDAAEARHLVEGLDWQGAIKDIQASVKWLKQNGSSKVGVTGYCMGGALAIASGVLVPEVDSVVAFYGTPSSELADPSKALAPIQAHFAELDTYVGFADVTAAKSLEEKLKSCGVPHEVHIYPGCSHAFMNASPEALENQGAIDLAWSRFATWMGRFL